MIRAYAPNPGLLATLLFVTVFSLPTVSAYGSAEMFLEIDGIEGESTIEGHEGEIDVLAWSWGMSQSGTMHVGGGGGGGKVSMQDLSFTKWVDKSSLPLMEALCKGNTYPNAKLTITINNNRLIAWVTITMTGIIVTSISTGGSGGEDRLTENVTVSYGKVQVDYQPQDIYGFLSGNLISYWWDILMNRGEITDSSGHTGFPLPTSAWRAAIRLK